jgi:hypothetical protein
MTRQRWIVLFLLAIFLSVGALFWARRPWRWWLLVRGPIPVERNDGLELRHRVFGFSPDDEHGHAVGAAGDVDRDGMSDFVVGAPYHDGGRVRLYSGRTGAVLREWRGDPQSDLGAAVGGAGGAVIAGAEGESASVPGSAVLFSGDSGRALRSFTGDVARDLFGHAVAAAGDVDGDGDPDFVIGAPGTWKKESIGYARVFSGRDGRALFTFQGERFAGDRFGFSVAGAGDVDRDGHADVLIGALGDTGRGSHSGRVYLFSGADGRKLFTADGDASHHELGHAVAGAGDLDGDGFADLFAGAFVQKGIGYARAYSGRTGRVIHELRGIEPGDAFGHSVAAAGDADGDGVGDLVAGAPDATVGEARRTGYVRIYSGKDGRVLLHRTGSRELMHYGYAVAAAGDVNGDFLADVIVGSVVVKDAGSAEVISACAVDPIEVQGELLLRRTRAGFLVSGGRAGTRGALLVEDGVGPPLVEEPFLFAASTATVAFSMIRPPLSGRTLLLYAVRTGTVTARSEPMKVRFCP